MNATVRSLLAGIAGFVVYGGWAVIANFAHGAQMATRAGWVQGTYSFILTFVMTYVTEWLYSMLKGVYLGLWWTVAIVSVILFTSAYTIHMLVGTPEILMTILPGYIIGTIYTAVYVWGLARADGKLPTRQDSLSGKMSASERER